MASAGLFEFRFCVFSLHATRQKSLLSRARGEHSHPARKIHHLHHQVHHLFTIPSNIPACRVTYFQFGFKSKCADSSRISGRLSAVEK